MQKNVQVKLMTELPEAILNIIKQNCGLVLSEIHKPTVLEFVNERMADLKMNLESYCAYLESKPQEMLSLINETTINETYFFREEYQFQFLKDEFFPSRCYIPTKIWCGACSTGEEPLSICALAKSMGLKVDIYASDINSNALNYFRKGIYRKRSFRNDGEKFHPLLKFIGEGNEAEFTVLPEELSNIKIQEINLSSFGSFPFEVNFFDVVILRNILYYFSPELSTQILKKVWNILKPDGIVILSINEIASFSLDEYYEKTKSGSVYYLKKKQSKLQTAMERQLEQKEADAEIQASKVQFLKENAEAAPPVQEIQQPKDAEYHEKADISTGYESMKKSYSRIYMLLDSCQYGRVEKILSETPISPAELEYKYYFQGLLNFYRGSIQQAEEFFFKTICLNNEFWPAHINLAFTYKKMGKTGKVPGLLNKALNILTEYLKSGKVCYNFTVEFDPEYFIALCRNHLNQAENGGE